jgi:hypothetical protein
MLLESESVFNKVTLSAYRPLSTTTSLLTPLSKSVNQILELEGAYLTVDGRPQILRGEAPLYLTSDSSMEVSLVWRALGEIQESYTVFVHLLDTSGRLIVQHDGIPAFGNRPTPLWHQDERILDKHRMTIPTMSADSSGVLIVGLYDSETVERQLFDDGQDHQWLANVMLSPDGRDSQEIPSDQ